VDSTKWIKGPQLKQWCVASLEEIKPPQGFFLITPKLIIAWYNAFDLNNQKHNYEII
jgi:hypothetical protein